MGHEVVAQPRVESTGEPGDGKLRNVAALFAHLLATDALPWSVLSCIRLTEEDTTSSSRIFIKYLFQVCVCVGGGG